MWTVCETNRSNCLYSLLAVEQVDWTTEGKQWTRPCNLSLKLYSTVGFVRLETKYKATREIRFAVKVVFFDVFVGFSTQQGNVSVW